jgi:RNA polymerase sigma-70 factor (ECF subfamily)
VVHILTYIAGDRRGAEDVAQEAFLRAWQRLGAYKPEGSFRNWIYTIAVHLALDAQRRQRPASNLDEFDPQDDLPGPEAVLEARQRTQKVRQAVQALPSASRAVLVLREYEGLSYNEIAAALGIPVGTVMSRLNYARDQLRRSLATYLAEG